jgi:hypothetical protein
LQFRVDFAVSPRRVLASILSVAVADANQRRRRTGLPPLQSFNQISIIAMIDTAETNEGLSRCAM